MQMPSFETQTRTVGWSLIGWGITLAILGFVFLDLERMWPIAAFTIAGLNVLLGILALKKRRWAVPLFVSLYLLPVASLVLGGVAQLDIYVATGVLSLCVLTVGACLLHALHRIAPPWSPAVSNAPATATPPELPRDPGTGSEEEGPRPAP